MAKPSPWKPFVCSQVRIKWKNANFDWPYFYVISCAGDGARLRGIDDPETGINHIGDEFNARWVQVSSISAIRQGESSAFFDMENGVLEKAKALVDGRDKQQNYGPPEEFMGRLAKMWGGYLGMELKPGDAALMMALLKAARLRTNPSHEDSLVDFAGYARIFERVK